MLSSTHGVLCGHIVRNRLFATIIPLAELLQIALGNKSLDISLTNVELAILGQSDRPAVLS